MAFVAQMPRHLPHAIERCVKELFVDQPHQLKIGVRFTANARLSPIRKRDLISAVSTSAAMLQRRPEEIAASVPKLREALLAIQPRLHGKTPKTMANIRANLAKALELTRAAPRPFPNREPSASWLAFLKAAPAKHNRHGLARFVRFCTMRGLDPSDVSDETLRQFQNHLDATILTNDPRQICISTAENWNVILTSAGLNFRALTRPASSRYVALPMTTYPETLCAEIVRYIDRLAHKDKFDDEGPIRALKPTSLRNVRAHLRQFLSALVESGVDASDLVSLQIAITPAHIRTAFTQILERYSGALPKGLHGIAGTLLAIARYWLKRPAAQLDAIKAIKAKVHSPYYGMTKQNRDRLAQFETRRSEQEFYTLPFKWITKAKAQPPSRRAALMAMNAVAMAILLCAPIRAKNLAGLELGRHLRSSGRGKARRFSIWIEATEVKNDAQLSFELPSDFSGLISDYLDTFRTLISPTPGDALFPKLSGGTREPGGFGAQLCAHIYKETGLKMNAHLFRHLAAKLYLENVPGDYETVRRLLMHKRLDTTLNAYASFDNRRAQERFHDYVLDARKGKRRR